MRAFLKYYLKDPIDLFQAKLRFWRSKETPVLVYTMAKVGSLSIYSSIKRQTSIPCFHIHSLNVQEHEAAKQLCFDQGVFPDSRSPASFIAQQIIEPSKSCKVISLFRDPVERNISAFFDAFEFYVGIPIDQFRGSMEELIQCFHEKLPHDYVIEWFEKKFERDTGIDLYETAFPVEKGYQFYTQNNYEVLLMNSSIEDSLKRELVAKFISKNSFQLMNVNMTAKKNKSSLYEEFKNTIRFEKTYLDRLLQSRYSQHFFSKEAIDSCYQKWLDQQE